MKYWMNKENWGVMRYSWNRKNVSERTENEKSSWVKSIYGEAITDDRNRGELVSCQWRHCYGWWVPNFGFWDLGFLCEYIFWFPLQVKVFVLHKFWKWNELEGFQNCEFGGATVARVDREVSLLIVISC